MSRIESLIIKSFLWILIPFAFFIIFWWSSSFLTIYEIFTFTENQVASTAISGLFIGLIIVFLTRNIILINFYSINNWFLILIYFFYSAVAFASMMGMPFGYLILGAIAGFYIGRKIRYKNLNPQIHFKTTSLFTSIVSGFWTLVICLLLLNEADYLEYFKNNSQLIDNIIVVPIIILTIIITILIIAVLQFYLTRFTCRLSFKYK